jgi:hypothetical protein
MPDLSRHHRRTLDLLWGHPLPHGLRLSQVAALLAALGAEVHRLDGQRLQIRFPHGAETWLHGGGGGLRRDELDAEAIQRLRHLLQEVGVGPHHLQPAEDSPRGDQARRVVLVLDHRQTQVFRLEGETVAHTLLRPHGAWATEQNLSHRHQRDIAGQRAPLDHAYLEQIAAAMADADAVLLLGHGHGSADMRQLVLHHLQSHHRPLLQHLVGVDTVEAGGLSEAQLLAIAHEHFGNLPHRRPLAAPGQELQRG